MTRSPRARRPRPRVPAGYSVTPSSASARTVALATASRRDVYTYAARSRRAESEAARLRYAAERDHTTVIDRQVAPYGYSVMTAMATVGTMAALDELYDNAAERGLDQDVSADLAAQVDSDGATVADYGADTGAEVADAPAGYDVMPTTDTPVAVETNPTADLSTGTDLDVGLDADVDAGMGL